jgi:hypothetical protein
MAVGLGSMDMPVPSVAEWEWLNWKFPRPVHAGDTIYARWTLTQKRPPVGSVATAIVVWRVDVHRADGALCAEGEVGASVTRNVVSAPAPVTGPEPAAAAASTSRRRRRRRTTPAGAETKPDSDGAAPAVAAATVAAPVTPTTPARSSGGARRRRRRRPASSSQARNGDAPTAATPTEAPSLPPPTPRSPAAAKAEVANPISRAIRRLRGT